MPSRWQRSRHALLRVDDVLDAVADPPVAGVILSPSDDSPTIELDPSTRAIEGYRAVLANLDGAVRRTWRGAIEDLHPEFLHDLRVALRRTRTVIAAGRDVLPDVTRGVAGEHFRWLAGLTTSPRDLDVIVSEWDANVASLAPGAAHALEPLLAEVRARRAAAHRELAAALGSDRAATVMTGWREWLAGPAVADARRAGHPLGDVVAKRIRRAHRRLTADGRAIDPVSPPEHLHELRKDAKKLRYLVECFGGMTSPARRKRVLKPLKALQDNVGEHQDATVHATWLRALLDETSPHLPSTAVAAAVEMVEGIDRRRAQAHAELTKRFADYDRPVAKRALRRLIDDMV